MSWVFLMVSWLNCVDGVGMCGFDDAMVCDFYYNIGVEIMGCNKFGFVCGFWENEDWKGWWGDELLFYILVFVFMYYLWLLFLLLDMMFHFVDGEPADVLARAREVVDGKDVRLGGGVSTIRQFFDVDFIDTLHIAVVPISIGSGLRLWDFFDDLLDRYHCDVVPSPSGVTHHLYWRC